MDYMARLELTATVVKTLECPDDKKRIEYCDTIVKGFFLECRSTNKLNGTYYLRWKNASNKTAYTKLGTQETISFQRARELALERKAEIAKGVNIEVKTKMPTLNEFFVQVYLPRAKLHQRSWTSTEGIFRRHLKPKLGDFPLDKITLKDVESIHSDLIVKGRAPATADHVSKQARAILNYAVRYDVISVNPVANVRLLKVENEVDNTLNEEELGRLLKVLETHPRKQACLVARFLLFTGARVGETLLSRWDHIDLENKIWTIPSSSAKSKRKRTVVLSSAALAVLDELDTKGKYEFLWINPRSQLRLKSISRAWVVIRNAAGLKKMRCHDLRHQHASSMILGGFSLYQVKTALGHSSSITSERYIHLPIKSRLEAVDSVASMAALALQKAS